MKRALVVILASLLWACPKPPPPTPHPTPTPPQLAQLSVVGNRFVADGEQFPFRLLSDCCDDPRTPNVDEGVVNGWGMTTPELIDQYASAPAAYRRNAIEMRIGPANMDPNWPNPYHYGNGYDILPQAKAICEKANSRGFYCYVIVNDAWVLASRPDLNLWGEDCNVTHAAPPDHWINWATTIAQTFKGMGVIYSLDNEGFRCRPSQSWEDGLYGVIKAVDSSVLVGSSHYPDRGLPNPDRRYYDFVAIQDTVQLPKAQPVPVVMVETEGLFHPEAHFRWLEAHADPGVYIGRWRAISSQAEWLYMVGAGPDPGPVCADAPDIGFVKVKHAQPRAGDATPLVDDWDWCQANGSPGRRRCPYVPEGGFGAGPMARSRATQPTAAEEPPPIQVEPSSRASGYKVWSGYGVSARAGVTPAQSELDIFRRISCEQERGWHFDWYMNGQQCDEYPLDNSTCWMLPNPLQVLVPLGNSGAVVKTCAKNGVCGEVTW